LLFVLVFYVLCESMADSGGEQISKRFVSVNLKDGLRLSKRLRKRLRKLKPKRRKMKL